MIAGGNHPLIPVEASVMKKFRVCLLIVWMILGIVLLFLIHYATIRVELQEIVTKITWAYMASAFIVAGVLAGLKKRSEISNSV